MTKTADWPYDADRDDPLTALRIPVTSSHPGWCYLVAFDRESAARPTEAETAMLVSFRQEYIDRWYNDSYKVRLAERPFDIDGGANGVIFRKWGDGDWGYRRRTWTVGPLYVPQNPAFPDRVLGPLTLPRLLDHIHSCGDGEPKRPWLEWKAAHPEVFGAAR